MANCLGASRGTREDFSCDVCGQRVTGDGYTNHCPVCLWSLHVDVNPGDRAATCRARMAPVQLLYERDAFVLVHRCTRCDTIVRNRTAAGDDLSVFLGE